MAQTWYQILSEQQCRRQPETRRHISEPCPSSWKAVSVDGGVLTGLPREVCDVRFGFGGSTYRRPLPLHEGRSNPKR